MKQSLALIAMTMIMVGFQNMDLLPIDESKISKVDEQKRVSHVKEILGFPYFNRFMKNYGELSEVNLKIYIELHKRLPAAYKARALDLTNAIIEEAEKHHFDPVFVMAVIFTESSFRPEMRGGAGEIGLMQILPPTAEWMAKKYDLPYEGESTLLDPVGNVRIGVQFMSYLRDMFDNKSFRYIAAYNMGPGNVRKLMAQKKRPKIYASHVVRRYRTLYSSLWSTHLEMQKSSDWKVAATQ